MTLPITPWPKITKIVTTVEQIGEVAPIKGYSSMDYNAILGGVIDGDAFFYTDADDGFYNQHQLNSFRIKRDGSSCRYIRANSNGIFDDMRGYNCFQIGTNTFIVGDAGGSLQRFTIPNTFINNGVIYVPNDLNLPPPPCGVGQFNEVVYDSINNLVAYVYINQFPENTFFWVSIYKLLPQGLVLQNSGYLGYNGDGITDIFNRATLELPPYVYPYYRTDQSSLRYSGGWSAYCSLYDTGLWNIGAAKQSIIQGGNPLVCGGDGNNQTYSTITESFNFSYDRVPSDFNYFYSFLNGYCENPNIFVSNATQAAFNVFCKDFFAQIFINVQLACIVILADGTFIGIGQSQDYEWYNPTPIYKGFIDFESYGLTFTPIVTQSQSQLINFSRPVSTNRSFIT